MISECLSILRTVLDKRQTALFSVKTSAGFSFVFDNQEVEKTSSRENSGKKKRKSHLGNVEYMVKREDQSIGKDDSVFNDRKPVE